MLDGDACEKGLGKEMNTSFDFDEQDKEIDNKETDNKKNNTIQENMFPWEANLPQVEIRKRASEEQQQRRRRIATWPPCFPLICHDIEHDLKTNAKPIARRSYFYWQCKNPN